MTPDFFQTSSPDASDPAAELLAGLAETNSHIEPWYLYDGIGSRLFDIITMTPEYYPTRTEAAIFAQHLPAMGKTTAAHGTLPNCSLIDLGAGSCEKAPKLFSTVQPRQYVPVDISVDYLKETVEIMQRQHTDIEMLGVGTDFSRQLVLPEKVQKERRLFFYPGSSIGNFKPHKACTFLQGVRHQMQNDGALWIGIDLVKDRQVMELAYDDELGVTAAFNRNILRNVNRITGTDFAPAKWRHISVFNEQESRIEMHLEAKSAMTVLWPNGARTFSAGERIHTEVSYKYTPDTFRALLERAGLRAIGMWTDDKQWFAVFAAVPA